MNRIPDWKRKRIVTLRNVGYSIPEIASALSVGITTVQRYVRGVEVPDKFLVRLRERQGGAKERAAGLRTNILTEATAFLGKLSNRELLILLVGIYWGEGTKKDFSIINSDPFLIQTFIRCIQSMGVTKERISYSLRVHSGVSISAAKVFWKKITGINGQEPVLVEVVDGKKKNKLPHGMCRLRIRSGIRERLFLQSVIALIGKESSKRVLSL